MKNMILSLVLAVTAFSINAVAGPSISGGGMPPHPALTAVSLVKSEAGIDYPTDCQSCQPAPHVLALYNGVRISIYAKEVSLVSAKKSDHIAAGIPLRVLKYKSNKSRTPVKISVEQGPNEDFYMWEVKGQKIDISNIQEIVKAERGFDYPAIEMPMDPSIQIPEMDTDFLVMVLRDGTRIQL
jgi:hypothetical protein